MKKVALLIIGVVLFSACLNDDYDNFVYEFVKIDEVITPESFTFGKKDTLKLKYSLPSSCYQFNDVYYEYQDTARLVAVRALVNVDADCKEVVTEREVSLVVEAVQKEDYLFKIYKGKDSDGKSIFEEIVVPVN